MRASFEAECGTPAGYQRHKRVLHEQPCETCREAAAAYRRKLRARRTGGGSDMTTDWVDPGPIGLRTHSAPAPDESWAQHATCRTHPDPDLWFAADPDQIASCGPRAPAGSSPTVRITVEHLEATVTSRGNSASADVHVPLGEAPGPTCTIGFNPGYLLDVLDTLDGDFVTLGYVDALKPVVTTDGPLTVLLMPVRIS